MAVAEATQHDMRAMDLALTIAERAASLDEVPVGAVVYDTRTGEVLTKAHNEVEQRGDATAHAELVAICRAMESIEGKRLTGYSLAVTLEPCCMCAGAIVHARLDRLVYGAPDPKAGAVSSLYEICTDARLNHRVEVISGIGGERSSELLKSFFRTKRS